MAEHAYITRVGRFLPNDPVSNEEMEEVLGKIGGRPLRARALVLRNNGIQNRHYALDRRGNVTHRNAEMTAEAIRPLFQGSGEEVMEGVDLLAAGTTVPDQFLPSHTSMVHGELGGGPVDILSPAGSCCSASHALKHAYLSILSGDKKKAVCAGSERFSPLLTADRFEAETERLEELSKDPYIAFEKEFLRWMLSDGAASLLLEDRPARGYSLRVDHLEGRSYANELEPCMYYGTVKDDTGSMTGWGEMKGQEWLDHSVFSIKQDVKLLRPNIVPYGGKMLKELFDRLGYSPRDIDFFLPHLSSEFFRSKIEEETEKLGVHIPQEKWFTNLSKVGNVGAASPFFMLEELFRSNSLEDGQRILLWSRKVLAFPISMLS